MNDLNPSRGSAVVPHNGSLNLAAPSVEAILDPIPGGEENLLPVSALGADLKVEFARWPTSNPGFGTELLTLWWDGEEVASKSWTGAIPEHDLFILLPKANLTRDGLHQLHYEVRDWGNNLHVSDPLAITIDTVAPAHPNNPAKLVFPMDVIFGHITNRYLEQNDDKVGATVPAYGYKPGDRLKGYWEDYPQGLKQVIDVELTEDLEVFFEGDMIRREGNGERAITYVLQDRAGNISRLSAFEKLTVNILPPEPRPLPSIVQAQPANPGEGVLDPKNYSGGVTARIPAQLDDISAATLTVHWKGFGEHGSFQTSTPSSTDGLDFKIPGSALPANFGKKVEVYYTVQWPTGEPETSAVYTVTVQRLLSGSFQKISCTQSSGGNLSLAAVPEAGANFSVPAWPFSPIADGMRINIWMTGQKPDNSAVRHDVLQGQPVPKGGHPVSAVLPRSFLLGLNLNATFASRVSVSFDDGETYLDCPFLDLKLIK